MFTSSHKFSQLFQTFLWSIFSFVFLMIIGWLSSANIAHGAEPTLAWDANTESDLAGYYIYYKTGTSGPPYDGTGSDEGNSPIQVPLSYLDDPTNPEFTVYGLSDNEIYFFVTTAYNSDGNESSFSNEVTFESSFSNEEIFDGSTYLGDSANTAGSGGGGGCFIATAAFGSKFEKHVQILRRFRDLYLMPHKIGRAFVYSYYKYSPPMADFIADHKTLRMVTRWSLLPLVGFSKMLFAVGAAPTLLLLVLMISTAIGCGRKLIRANPLKKICPC